MRQAQADQGRAGTHSDPLASGGSVQMAAASRWLMHGLVQSFDAYIGVIWQVSRAAFPNNVDAAMALTS